MLVERPFAAFLFLHHDVDRRRRRVVLDTNGRLSLSVCVPRPGHSTEFGERAAGGACQAGVNLVGNSRKGCNVKCVSIHVSSHARTRASLTVLSLVCPAAAASDAFPAVFSCVRSCTEVASAVPWGGGAPWVGFPVRPKICVLSQWSR